MYSLRCSHHCESGLRNTSTDQGVVNPRANNINKLMAHTKSEFRSFTSMTTQPKPTTLMCCNGCGCLNIITNPRPGAALCGMLQCTPAALLYHTPYQYTDADTYPLTVWSTGAIHITHSLSYNLLAMCSLTTSVQLYQYLYTVPHMVHTSVLHSWQQNLGRTRHVQQQPQCYK